MAHGTRPPQHLGGDAARGLLEIRCAAKARRREAWFVRAQGQQFFPAPGRREKHGSGLARRQGTTRARASRDARGHYESLAQESVAQGAPHALRNCVSRYLPRGTGSPPAPPSIQAVAPTYFAA